MIRKFFENREHRKRIIEHVSFIISCIFGAFNTTLWVISKSIWYLMLSIYYVALSFARGSIYLRKHKPISKIKEIKIYRDSGAFLLIMNFAVGISALLTVFFEGTFRYSGIFIYGVAIYTAFKILFAIINISRAQGTNNYLELAYRSINLVDGSFSIFALQAALVNQFSKNTENLSLANILTGSFVVLFGFALGIFMLIRAKREICSK